MQRAAELAAKVRNGYELVCKSNDSLDLFSALTAKYGIKKGIDSLLTNDRGMLRYSSELDILLL